MTTAAKVLERVRDIVSGNGPRPIAGPLEVGERAHWLLSDAAGWRAAHHGRLLPALYGVPIVPCADLGTEWRLLNREGDVIIDGEIDGP